MVGQGREELAVQVAGVCLDLDAVEACLLCDDRSVCLPLDELLDLLNGELLGHLKVSESAGDGGRCNSLLALNACAVCASAAMHELCKYLAAALVDGIGQLLERGDVLLVGEHCAVVGVVAQLIPLHVCENYKADSAERTASVKFNHIIHYKAVDGMAYAHGRHDHSVLQLKLVDLERCIKSFHIYLLSIITSAQYRLSRPGN